MLFVLDTLYRLDSMLKAMAPYDVLVSTVTAFLIVLVAGGLLVLAGLGAVLLVGPLRSNLLTLVMWLALVFLVLIFCRGLLEWLHQVSGADARVLETWVYSWLGIRISPGVWRSFFYVSVVAVVCVYLLKAERLHAAFAAIEGMGKALARAALFMAVAAVAFVGYHMVSGRSGRSSPVCATRFQTSGGTWRDAATRDPQPDIVLVTFDALTARDMSLYGYRLLTTPGLERLSGESHVYESAISVANWTKPSTVSILTGQYPHHHGLVSTFRDAVALGNSDRTLPALLRE
ncbi:MAG: sulfatase-like hydrolase/transferase, partial [Gemmatimonadetes bacterium]|nr:sulfatase-like hydrolase/transferase [Gemmatimonadota bacterium]